MAGGAYVALSGLRARMEQLDRLSSDIANLGSAGYKGEQQSTVASERPAEFSTLLQSAVDTAPGTRRMDFRPGTIAPTGRDLDFAIEGSGFFVIDTPNGPEYTRNGFFSRGADGVLKTDDGFPVLGDNGPLQLGPGTLVADSDGTLRVGGAAVGKLRVVEVNEPDALARTDGSRFHYAGANAPQVVATPVVRAGALEQSNVSAVDGIVKLTELTRSFESLQRGISVLMNDVDGRAISELGRK